MTPQTIACQAPWFMEFSRQEYWSGLPFHSAGDLLNPGTELGLPHCRQIFFFFFFYHLSHQGSPKKAESRTDTFKLWCWRRLLRVFWTARTSNQSILKEINPEYSLEGLMLKLKLLYFGHLMRRADSLEKTLMLGKMEGGRGRG